MPGSPKHAGLPGRTEPTSSVSMHRRAWSAPTAWFSISRATTIARSWPSTTRRASSGSSGWVRTGTTIGSTQGEWSMADVKPIRCEADYDAALAEVGRLWGAKSGTPKGDRLDVLATLIDAWESEHHRIDPPDPIEAIKFRMEQQNLTRKDLEGIFWTRTRVAE